MPDAITELTKVIQGGVTTQTLDERYDLLKLLGLVIAQATLLKVAIDPDAEAAARVSAARALLSIKESPESIAERLRRSPFANLTVKQLEAIVAEAGESGANLRQMLSDTTQGGGSPNGPPSHEPPG